MSMRVELVEPEGELWSGEAELVIARTVDGEIGLMSDHAPLIGLLYEGSMIQIRPDSGNAADVFAAVTGGFLSVANNRVSILARQAQLGRDVDPAVAQAALDQAIRDAGPAANAPEEPASIRYCRALLRAAAGQAS